MTYPVGRHNILSWVVSGSSDRMTNVRAGQRCRGETVGSAKLNPTQLTDFGLVLVSEQKVDCLNPPDHRLPKSIRKTAGRKEIGVMNKEDVVVGDDLRSVLNGLGLAERCTALHEHRIDLWAVCRS